MSIEPDACCSGVWDGEHERYDHAPNCKRNDPFLLSEHNSGIFDPLLPPPEFG